MTESKETFFKSRWVECPGGAEEVAPALLPQGFRASAAASGVRSEGLDLGILCCDSVDVTSAARFTKNAVFAAPVELNLSEAGLDILRAIVVNSGNANCCTGKEGLDRARTVRDRAAAKLELKPSTVAVASTGVIGEELPVEKVLEGIEQASGQLDNAAANKFAQAILTTDSGPKQATLKLEIGGREVILSGQAKGAGMLSPAFSSATLLCFVETDAYLAPGSLDSGLDKLLANSFERVTVDGQLSTNDSFFLMASGASGADCTGSGLFYDALMALMRQLALELVVDGEGASKVTRLLVQGAHDDEEAEAVARAVAGSPLVKTAVFGGDPNWGRVLQAAGAAIGLRSHHRERVEPSLRLEDVKLCDRATGVEPQPGRESLKSLMGSSEVEMRLDLHRGSHGSEVFFSDLTYDYVKLNAEYVT